MESPSDVFTNDILSFWFGGTLDEQFQRWFSSGSTQAELDSFITEKYGELLVDNLDFDILWNESLQSRVAKIILFDQFSRHVFR